MNWTINLVQNTLSKEYQEVYSSIRPGEKEYTLYKRVDDVKTLIKSVLVPCTPTCTCAYISPLAKSQKGPLSAKVMH